MATTLPQPPFRLDQKRIAQAILLAALVLVVFRGVLPAGLVRLPGALVLPFADWINAGFDFARDDLGLMTFTRAFSDVVEFCLDVTANLLYGKSRWPHVGPIPWVVIAATAGMAGYALGGLRLGVLAGGTFVWIAVMGQWKWAMETLSVIVVAVPFSVIFGLLMGVLAWRYRMAERILNPILNIAQSLPHFAYMIPVVVFIGVGPKAGAIVTIIFSVPPMIRMSLLGLRAVSPEIIESGKMSGTTRLQLMTRVRLPAARTEILIGVNQVIMQSLAMVVLASFIGMPGLGQKLLQLLQGLKIGLSVEIGVTIVLLAIVLDRLSKAWALKQPEHVEGSWLRRHRVLAVWLGLVALGFVAAWSHPYFAEVERKQALSMAGPVDAVVGGFIDLIDPVTDWLRWFLITWVLIPLRNAFLWLPTTAVLLALVGVGWRIGGWRSALVCLAFALPIALSGWWDRAMITAYTVFVAVALALMIGVPLGLLGAANETRARRFLLVCDTAQTFPSFIYLIPVIMLFGVNDVAVIAAVMVFATVPIVRYTIEGLRSIPPEIVESAQMSGASAGQLLRHVKLPLAVPTLVVGANQSIMFALFMVIIAAFIGTQDLGQEMQRALSSTDVGKGLVLGLAVAFMGLMADHLLLKWARNHEAAMGR
ncbi:proline/glycine betaine ABC transporter permease [Tabrizicola sp.]|uniref:ABC transporter permease n=1 Tax=Tabrizicola sp. TaxID=2005166 RepID=UPI002736930D|nr:ABC transporter permease subunit [Tabrizicola sp.]MDP3194990.1 ABC transporter permease subunit [Tabrizicola sp.]